MKAAGTLLLRPLKPRGEAAYCRGKLVNPVDREISKGNVRM